ncbi:MAG TPA: hypothetical protein VH916_00100 [Dehalococcoidia bacterium]|jgi:hypothetical protein
MDGTPAGGQREPKGCTRPHDRAGDDSTAAAPYAAVDLARLRAAIRAGLLSTPPQTSDRDTAPPEESPSTEAPLVVPDPLPEHTDYRDEGCHVAPACLCCPLERCIYDRPKRSDAAALRSRDRRMRTLALRGWNVERLAGLFHLSPAHVRRILRPGSARRRARRQASPNGRR